MAQTPPNHPNRVGLTDDKQKSIGVHIPTPERLRLWRDNIVFENNVLQGAIKDYLDSVDTFVSEGTNPVSKQSRIYTAFQRLKTIAEEEGVNIDIFLDNSMMNRARALDTELSGDQDSHNLSRGHHEVSSPEQEAATRAYTQLGWAMGDGSSRNKAIIVGSLSKAPEIKNSTLAISDSINGDAAIRLRGHFEQWLAQYRYQGTYRGRPGLWMRLHPWSIQLLGHIFFYDFTGPGFSRSLTDIVIALQAPIADASTPTSPYELRARRAIALDYLNLPPSAISVFEAVAKVGNRNYGKDAYVNLVKTTTELRLLRQFQLFLRRCANNPRGHEARIIKTIPNYTPGGARGVDYRTLAREFFAWKLQMQRSDLDNLLSRASPLVPFYDQYGAAILLLFRPDIPSKLLKVGLTPLPAIMAKFDEIVPDFAAGMMHLHRKVAGQLISLGETDITLFQAWQFVTNRTTNHARGTSWSTQVRHIFKHKEPPLTSDEQDTHARRADADEYEDGDH